MLAPCGRFVLGLGLLTQLLCEELSMTRQEWSLFFSERLYATRRIYGPAIQNIGRQGWMHLHLAVVLESNELFIEERIHVGRQENAVMAIETLGIAAFAPRLDMTGDQHARIGNAGHATRAVQKDHALAKQALSDPRLRQLQTLSHGKRFVGFY